MSIKDHLTRKAGNIGEAVDNAIKRPGSGQASPKTTPGQMLAFRGEMQQSQNKIDALEKQLDAFRDAVPARLLDPHKIRRSAWANRSDGSFNDAAFDELKADIESAGGNVQPIKVRRIQGTDEFEVVFGHRRHQVCLVLGLPVLAIVVDDMPDQTLFVEMDQENRARKDLSPWEQGAWYRRALDGKLWPSQNALAKALGLSQGNVSSALLVADLPREVVEAFKDPNDLQFRWARAISEEVKRDKAGVIKRAVQAKARADLGAREVFRLIMNAEGSGAGAVEDEGVSIKRKGGALSILCGKVSLSDSQEKELKKLVDAFIKKLA